MGPSALEFQERVSGVTRGWEYQVHAPDGTPVDFDAYKDGKLIDAKDHYEHLLNADGTWKAFFDPEREFVEKARRQLRAANHHGTPLEWHVAESRVADAPRELFATNKIDVPVLHVGR
jgi:hypothetical protein